MNIKNAFISRPHLVVLGAGASVAAFPHGDLNGRTMPTMNNFIRVLKIEELKNKENENIEDVYSELIANKESDEILRSIESKIRHYFFTMEMPEHPTLYDHLILSLTKKDIIATFNWDPFLLKARQRVYEKITKDVPQLIFLHGNVAIKIDYKNRKVFDYSCSRPDLDECPLLYPVKDKDYTADNFIKCEWDRVQEGLERAYYLTIFGYSAPMSDIQAQILMNKAFARNKSRHLLQIEFIDIKNKEEIDKTWEPFIIENNFHYDHYSSFYKSALACFPRRTCEALFEQTQECNFDVKSNPIPFNLSWDNLEAWYKTSF